ncbi:helix-turn-helix domain-containing protein [Pseudonocardia xishanensis]|uniref:Helix-turn-helix domain-containing protein n=1 Tax=Pseudonocardia xishanensis TaxID=630995 RepID=A0ABP8RWG2_9PSEU
MPSATPLFHTVAEAAALLRVDTATVYRAIRDDAFPAVRIRGRYVIPAKAIDQMIEAATESGRCLDVADILARQRIQRELGESSPHPVR